MKRSPPLSLFLAGLLSISMAWAADDSADAPPEKARPTRLELRDKQYDVSLDARDIERILTRLKRASELSKQRMTEAAEAAENVSGQIERGDAAEARKRAEETSKMFQEIAKQLEALLTEETPQRVAAARNLAAQLARAEQQFAQQAQKMSKQMQAAQIGGGTSDPNAKPPADSKPQNGKGGQRPADPMEDPKDKGSGSGTPQPNPADEPGKNSEKKDDGDQPEPGKGGKDKPEPMPNAKGGGEEDKNPEGDGKNKDDQPQPGQGSGKDKPKPMPEANGGGGDADKDPDGDSKDGIGKAKDEDKPNPDGTGGGKPKKEDPVKDGTGGGATDETDPQNKDNRRGGGGATRLLSPEEQKEKLADRASELASRAETLLDILNAIANSDDPADKDAAEKVNALLKETDLKNAIAGLQASAAQVRNQQLEDARATALDIAERLQITTQRLDAVYRSIIGPQAEELRKLEQQLLQLREKLEELQTPAQITAWHRAVRELLDKADELGISETRREELLEEMKKQGFNLNSGRVDVDWQIADGRYQAPAIYTTRLVAIQEEIQSRIQNLILGEFASMTDDLAPPKYQSLVERYYQVLSREGNSRTGTATPAKSPAKP